MNQTEAADFVANGPDEQKFARYWLPYCFQKIEWSGVKWSYLPLNRDYKPLGSRTKDHVDYDLFAPTHGVRFSRNPALMSDIWLPEPELNATQLWLYSDGPKSRLTYFARLERVMLKTKMLVSSC